MANLRVGCPINDYRFWRGDVYLEYTNHRLYGKNCKEQMAAAEIIGGEDEKWVWSRLPYPERGDISERTRAPMFRYPFSISNQKAYEQQ